MLFQVPNAVELQEPLKKVFPVGNGYLSLAYTLGKQAGQELEPEGVLRWLLLGIETEGMGFGLRFTIPKIIKYLISNEEMYVAVLTLFNQQTK
ncbi:MAG: hypothetical protein ACOZAO_04295 [Patescibacteria group bacterium]